MKLSSQVIDNPLYSFMAFAFIIIVGLFAFMNLQKEFLPKVTPPFILVNIPYPGASSQEVESQINKELEPVLSEITDLVEITTIAIQGASNIFLEFESRTDIKKAKRKVQDAIGGELGSLPKDVETPMIQSFETDKMSEMLLVIYGPEFDYVLLKDNAKKIKNIIKAIPLIKDVKIYGGLDREIHVDIDPVILEQYQISLIKIIRFFKQNNINQPAGALHIDGQKYYSRILSEFKNIQDIRNAIIQYKNNEAVHLDDIASINMKHSNAKQLGRFNQQPAISLGILGKNTSNIQDVANSVYKQLELIQNSNLLPEGMQIGVIDDISSEVRVRVNQLTSSIILGIMVVFFVMFMATGLQTALISGLGIPFCCLFAFIGMLSINQTLNNVSQMGFIIMIGVIIDGAIIILENIYRHIEDGKDTIQATKEGLHEIGSAVISSVLTTMIAFIPLLFITGMAGDFMSNIPKVIIMALLGALLFDHIFIPVLAAYLLKSKIVTGFTLIRRLFMHVMPTKIYQLRLVYIPCIQSKQIDPFKRIRKFSLKHPFLLIIIMIIFLVGSLKLASNIENEFFPKFDRGFFFINIRHPAGTSLAHNKKLTEKLEPILQKYVRNQDNLNGPIQYYFTDIGSSGIATKMLNTSQAANVSMVFVKLVDEFKRDVSDSEIIEQLRNRILKKVAIEGYIKFNMRGGGPPAGDPIKISVKGKNLQTLKNLGNKIQARIADIPDIINIRDNYSKGRVEIQINIDREKLAQYQISVKDIQEFLLILSSGSTISKYYTYGEDKLDIRIRLQEQYRDNINSFTNLYYHHPIRQQQIPMSELITMSIGQSTSLIYRQDEQRIININADITKNINSSVAIGKIKSALNSFELPKGYKISYKGEAKKQNESFASLGNAFMLGSILIYMILILQFKSFIQPLIILSVIPFSLIGVTMGLLITGNKIGIMVLFGMISLTGIVVNDSIVLISYINQLRQKGNSLTESIIKASQIKTRPIFLTTITTIGGLLPLIISQSNTMIFWHPLAWTIISGLSFATFITLTLTPVLYYVFETGKMKILKIVLRRSNH